MNLTGISKELNFSNEVLSNANALMELRKDGLLKINSLTQKIKKINKKKQSQQLEEYRKDLVAAKEFQTSIQKQDDAMRIPTLKKLKEEYKTLNQTVKKEVRNLIKNTKQKYADLCTEVENEYQTQVNALEVEKNSLDFTKKEDKALYKEKLNGITIKRKKSLKNLDEGKIAGRDRLQKGFP